MDAFIRGSTNNKVDNIDKNEEENIEDESPETQALYSILPQHCSAYKQFLNQAPKREPAPVQVLHPDVCFKSCPRIISRSKWRARVPKKPVEQMMYRARAAIFKLVEVPGCKDQIECMIQLHSLQMYEIDYLNFQDIAYSFLIDEDGRIYEGRGWGTENEKGTGFCGIGYMRNHSVENKPVQEPTDAMLQATYDLIMCGVRMGFISNPFCTGGYVGDTPIELIKDMLTGSEEPVDYSTKTEDYGIY